MADPKLAKKIDAAKEKASDVDTDALESAAYPVVIESLHDNFDFVGGSIQVGVNFTRQLNAFVNQIGAVLKIAPKFIGAVSTFVKRIPQIKDAIDDFQAAQGITVPAESAAAKLIELEFKEAVLREGLNQHFVQPLRDLIYRDSLSGLTMKEAQGLIKDYVRSGADRSGKLKSYVQQTAQQAVDAYSGVISMKLMNEFKYDGFLMTGSLIDTSSPQCRYVVEELGGTITRKDWPTVKKIAKNHGLIEGTNFNNLPVNQLHWSCRHSFYPYVKN